MGFNMRDVGERVQSHMNALHCAKWFMVCQCVCGAEWEGTASVKNQLKKRIVLWDAESWCMIIKLRPVIHTIHHLPATQMHKHNSTLSRECELTVRFHPHCGEFGVREGRVLDHAGHAVLVLQVGGEAEDAAQGGGAVWVSSVTRVHSENIIWGRKAAD